MEILVITKKKRIMKETKFKVGDVVKVKSLDWYNSNKAEDGSVTVEGSFTFTKDMKELCGKFFYVEGIKEACLSLKTQKDYVFHSWMLEDQVYELEEVDLSKEEVNVNDPKFFTRNLVPLWIEGKLILPIYKAVPAVTKFQPFQKVLVKDMASINDCFTVWSIDFYSYFDMESHMHRCLGGLWDHCVPYEGNEHLLGTREETC